MVFLIHDSLNYAINISEVIVLQESFQSIQMQSNLKDDILAERSPYVPEALLKSGGTRGLVRLSHDHITGRSRRTRWVRRDALNIPVECKEKWEKKELKN